MCENITEQEKKHYTSKEGVEPILVLRNKSWQGLAIYPDNVIWAICDDSHYDLLFTLPSGWKITKHEE